jgi:hypothetical protein
MIWHPTKWWIQEIDGEQYVWPGQGDPPGLLDSGNYCGVRYGDLTPWPCIDPETALASGGSVAGSYYQCLSCCCGPAKCQMPQEIMLTISGFSGTLSSIDRPSDYGYGAGNVCPECSINWTGCPKEWIGYTPECCDCRKNEMWYWWPRDIVGTGATGGDICARERPICATFPHICSGSSQSVTTSGRIAGRFINLCPYGPCVDFVWSDYTVYPQGRYPWAQSYSLVELTDCADAPMADAREDYECITKPKIEYVKEADSYLWPPGFKGPMHNNLLPLCNGIFWNDEVYYRKCVKGGFWCQTPYENGVCYSICGFWGCDRTLITSDEDFFWKLQRSDVENDAWRTSKWCEDSPTRCAPHGDASVPIADVRWRFKRPRNVLISQPSKYNCAPCTSFGFGYGSSMTNYGYGTDWYDPTDDGHCTGKTDINMNDFNQSFMLRAEMTEAPPYLKTQLRNRNRVKPEGATRIIDAQLLYQLTKYAQNTEDPNYPDYCDCVTRELPYWRVDYPCEPKIFQPCGKYGCFICDRSYGQVAPKLNVFYKGNTGSGAEFKWTLDLYCPFGVGAYFNGGWWYVSAVSVVEDSSGVIKNGGNYEVGDEFVFDFYESPARGGEAHFATKDGTKQQTIIVTNVSKDGEILGIRLKKTAERCEYDLNDEGYPEWPKVPLYCRFLAHRYAVGIPGNGYEEGDEIEFFAVPTAPEGLIETGNRYYPYFDTTYIAEENAIAVVTEVDDQGGIVDWYMCGAQNHFWADHPSRTDDEKECAYDPQTGKYYDIKYENRCVYNYTGVIPVRYSWSGVFDYHFHQKTYCEHAWAEFNFRIDQISVKNTISAPAPTQTWGKQAKLRIKSVSDMELYGVEIDKLKYQNYEISPGPNATATSTFYNDGEHAWFKNHDIPIPQGGVTLGRTGIEVVEKGAGYVKKVQNEDGTYRWEPLELATYYTADFPPGAFGDNPPGLIMRGVADDMRLYMASEYGWPTFCVCKANIKMDVPEDHPNFGGIDSIDVLQGGMWYFAHEHDHLWFAKAGSNWYFELAWPQDPTKDFEPPPDASYLFEGISGVCYHASRDNWGEMHHYDGFVEPYPSSYHSNTYTLPPVYDPLDPTAIITPEREYTSYTCAVGTADGVWPKSPITFTGSPGYSPAGDPEKRWSKTFCPNNLLNNAFRMILLHPCAACAKELGIAGGQTCWNMAGFGDSTTSPYPDMWSGTGTAMITKLAGELTFRFAVPEEE